MSSPTSNLEPACRPTTLRANSSAYFQGQLKNIQGSTATPQEDEVVVTEDGKTVRVKHSEQQYQIPADNSVAVPTATDLVATLFYTGKKPQDITGTEDEPNEKLPEYVSDLAIFEFIQTIDALSVPYQKSKAYHRVLDNNAQQPKVVEIAFTLPKMLELVDLRRHEDIWAFERKWGVEVILQKNDVFRRYKRLAVFDMDSTLIEQEVIDEIARVIGVVDEVSAITHRAMNGELDFTQSLRSRVALLKGAPASVFEDLKSVITFTPGARELCKALKALGFKLAVLSGGFIPLANYIKEELGLDYAFANQLVVNDDGTELTGELTGDIVDAEHKAVLLQRIAEENGIPLQQVFACGDGANDLKMMYKAGLGIAFNAKPTVQAEAPCRINTKTLRDVLYILGLSEDEQSQLI
ncbi:HAD-like domain-containing protein [Pyronema domesticum]|uniref:phosphoserine phosphatase n=1 Tax=Pyronema omphalodes (strain CBS 100304) TaxID=1076935 RepID=U4LMU2_PYROM|nr:HAD-like domain-containing protein [Pyronema domesticum]CCX15512.1 Similar to Probable phosphoserine phosphatase; acc. no. O74382 [Pyronema omphalodes CBS 100304]